MKTTTTAAGTLKFGFYNSKPLLAAYENDIVYEDMPQFPGDDEYKAILAQLRQAPEAAQLIETVADAAVDVAQAHSRKCSGEAWSAAAAELHMLAIDLVIEKSIPTSQYVVANYIIKRIRDRLGLAVCTAAGLDHLRTLLTSTVDQICYLSGQQQELVI